MKPYSVELLQDIICVFNILQTKIDSFLKKVLSFGMSP